MDPRNCQHVEIIGATRGWPVSMVVSSRELWFFHALPIKHGMFQTWKRSFNQFLGPSAEIVTLSYASEPQPSFPIIPKVILTFPTRHCSPLKGLLLMVTYCDGYTLYPPGKLTICY